MSEHTSPTATREDREAWWRGMGTLDRLRVMVAENERLHAAIEQHRQDYADAIGPQTKDRGEMNRKKRDAAHRLWESIGEPGQ